MTARSGFFNKSFMQEIPHKKRSLRKQKMANSELWYKNDIFYELYVRAFRDSNGDGWGDLKGVAEKLDYLSYLGVDTIWLLPISPSPLRDDGYDVSDYCGIHRMYGNMQDFQELLRRRISARSRFWSSWCQTTPPTSTPGSRPRETRITRSTKNTVIITSGAILTKNIRTRVSSSWIAKSPTGLTTLFASSISGTASSITSQT